MAVILTVDDSMTDLTMISSFLVTHTILQAQDGEEGLSVLVSHPEIDLVLLDLHMPKMDGFTFIEECASRDIDIPIMILTNSEDLEKEIRGLEMGAVDYVRKPLNFLSLQKRIELQLRILSAQRERIEYSHQLEELVEKRTAEVRRTNEITISALVRLLETRSVESSDHSSRTREMMELLCRRLTKEGPEEYHLQEREIQELVSTAPLHDIGKVGIPDAVLLKPGRLNDEELALMREHVSIGVEALEYSIDRNEADISFIETAKELIASHHEWFDGSGYPAGLKGKAIPLSGRLMAVIDVYDALTHKRVYKDELSHEEALEVMRREAERHFDPVVFSMFTQVAQGEQDRGRSV